MKKFAVFGNPIAHSKSPEIHQLFAHNSNVQLEYRRLLISIDNFNEAAAAFFSDAHGANVTVPFKEDALAFADTLSEAATLAGAVNTLTKKGTIIIGDNTDGIGLVRDIRDNHNYSLTDKKILIIGAGGASRGVILPIAQEQPASITIANRTVEKAVQLAQQFSNHIDININTSTINAVNTPYDIIINATSASLAGHSLPLSPIIFSTNSLAYDMMYAEQPTAFMQLAQQNGAHAADGLGMLVEQAAKSFEIWHGITPETRSVIKHIRNTL